MSTKYNNNTLSGITFVDSNGSKIVYGIIFNDKKVWGEKRNLYVRYSNNVENVVVSRTKNGYEPTVSTGTISGKLTQEQYVMQYDVYAGDTINVSAYAKNGYVITGGLGQVTVSSDSGSDIHVYISTTQATVFANGTISQSGNTITEELLIQNDRQSSIKVVSMTGNVLQNTAMQLPVTILANSSGSIVGSTSGITPIATDYTINLTLSDGTVVSCSMTVK